MGSAVPHSTVRPATDTALAAAASFSDFLPCLLPPEEVHLAPLCQSVSQPGEPWAVQMGSQRVLQSLGQHPFAVGHSHLGAQET